MNLTSISNCWFLNSSFPKKRRYGTYPSHGLEKSMRFMGLTIDEFVDLLPRWVGSSNRKRPPPRHHPIFRVSLCGASHHPYHSSPAASLPAAPKRRCPRRLAASERFSCFPRHGRCRAVKIEAAIDKGVLYLSV